MNNHLIFIDSKYIFIYLLTLIYTDENAYLQTPFEKLLDAKTARFCGEVLFENKPYGFVPKKLLDDEIRSV
jgi:hypothetical protein